MKKALTFLFVLLIITLSYGQQNFDPEQDSPLPKNELKLNMLELLVMPAIGITYERFINDHSSYGIYGFVNFDTDTGYRYEKFELAPFYRIYLQSKKMLLTKVFMRSYLLELTEWKQNFTITMTVLFSIVAV